MATELPRRHLGETKDVILRRMLDRSPVDIDKRQGTITWDTLSPASIELERLYIELDNVLQFGFVNENQPREYLELRCKEIGITPKPALKAIGTVTFYGDDGTLVPAGTRVYTDEETPVYFVTVEEGTITDGQATISTEAEQGGTDGNVPAGAISLHVGNIVGVANVVNEVPFEGGTDVETDESLLQRYFDRVRLPATSGNAGHYHIWATEVAGVGAVKVYPLWDGAGTVKVVITSGDKRAPTGALIGDVYTHIEENRPIGAEVTVEGAVEKPFTITANINVASGYTIQQIQADFERSVIGYFNSVAFVETYISYAQIGRLLFDIKGLVDHTGLLVNGDINNILLEDIEVPILETVTLGVVV